MRLITMITTGMPLSSCGPEDPTDSTALPFRMFGAHCVALRLSLNGLTVSD